MHKYSHIFYTILLASFAFLTPTIGFAQQNQIIPQAVPVSQNFQQLQVDAANQAFGGASSTSSVETAAGDVSTCIGSSAIVGAVQGQISKVVGSLTDVFRVPTGNVVTEGKETGVLGVISWDQLGWCLVNSVIASITDSTINWINSGFEGNPVFLDNPAAYFADLADIQAAQFLNELSGGFLCQPIQNIVQINLAETYNSRIAPYDEGAQCTFSAISGNLEQFMSGETFSWGDWMSFTQEPQNNPMGATIYGQIELDRRIAQVLSIEKTQLDWGAGFFSIKDKETGKVTTPGNLIEDQVNKRLGSAQNRLEIADEFNEVIDALVSQLIKMAISDILG